MSALVVLVVTVTTGTCSAEPLPAPTRAEVIAFELDAHERRGETNCISFSLKKGERCKDTRRPVVITGKPLDELTAVLRNRASYDLTRSAACHEPRHRVKFYYGTSLLDVFDVCFACNNVSVSGSNPFVGCNPSGATAMPSIMNLTSAAYEQLREVLARAKVGLVPKRAEK